MDDLETYLGDQFTPTIEHFILNSVSFKYIRFFS